MKARTKGARKRSRGRPRIETPFREPNGRVSRSQDPADKLALETRARMLGLSLIDAKNQLAATWIGRLHMQYQAWEARDKGHPRPPDSLSRREYDAATRYIALHNDRLKVIQAEGAQYSGMGASEDIEALERWGRRVNADYAEVRRAIQDAQDRTRSDNLWAALDHCILRDTELPYMVGTLRLLCNVLARHWGM